MRYGNGAADNMLSVFQITNEDALGFPDNQ